MITVVTYEGVTVKNKKESQSHVEFYIRWFNYPLLWSYFYDPIGMGREEVTEETLPSTVSSSSFSVQVGLETLVTVYVVSDRCTLTNVNFIDFTSL